MRRVTVQRHATSLFGYGSSSRSAGLLLAIGLSAAGCVLVKEPLRSGWLIDGVYPQPPPPACDPKIPAGRPYDDLAAHPVPGGEAAAEFEVELPLIGKVTARMRGAASVGPGVLVSSKAARPYRVLDEAATGQQVPGFVHRVDLRSFARVAFASDVSGYMCANMQSCPEGEMKWGPPAPYLQAMGDQIDAGVAGLRADQFFVVHAGDAGRSLRFTPDTPYGRSLAGQFIRGQVCSHQRGPSAVFARALLDAPDVIVFMSDGEAATDHAYEDKYGGCGVYPHSFHCTVNEKTEELYPDRLFGRKPMPPVIAISVHRKDSTWMKNLAEATGGVYLDAVR
jgi:hypothetical protein